MVLATDALHLGWVCACSELTCALSFAIGVRSQGSFDARVSGIASSPTRPSRSCRSAKHPARSASASTSITSHGSFSAPHVRMKLRSLPSPRLRWRTVIPLDRPNCTGTFQCHSTSERANFRDRPSDGSDRGSRSSGCLVMVVVLLFALLGRCMAGAQKHRTAGVLGISVSMRVPARIPLVSTARALRSARRRA